jgi:hypothetical protein
MTWRALSISPWLRGFRPVVFIVGEAGPGQAHYADNLGEAALPAGVELGELRIIPRPKAAAPNVPPPAGAPRDTELRVSESGFRMFRSTPAIRPAPRVAGVSAAGAYTRPLLSSTRADSVTKDTLNPP